MTVGLGSCGRCWRCWRRDVFAQFLQGHFWLLRWLRMKKLRDWGPGIVKVQAEGQCRVCGRSDALDPAHIVPRSRGGDMAAENIVPLDRDCHTAYDSGELELLPYLTLEEQAHAAGLVGIAEVYRRTTVTA